MSSTSRVAVVSIPSKLAESLRSFLEKSDLGKIEATLLAGHDGEVNMQSGKTIINSQRKGALWTNVLQVTGANKGIGFAIVRRLCKEFSGTVILTARDEERGQAAVRQLNDEGLTPKFHKLDIVSPESIEKIKKYLVEQYGGLDLLVNNAGIAFKMASTAPFSEQAEVTLHTNFHGTLNMCRAMLPILKPHARLVNISTHLGGLSQLSQELQKTFSSPTLTEESLVNLMDQFVQDVKDGVHSQKGWSNTAYGISHVGIIALTKILARAMADDPRSDILINACDPGWVRTDMAGPKATKSPDEGADTPVYAALLPTNAQMPQGEFLKDRTVQQWEVMSYKSHAVAAEEKAQGKKD